MSIKSLCSIFSLVAGISMLTISANAASNVGPAKDGVALIRAAKKSASEAEKAAFETAASSIELGLISLVALDFSPENVQKHTEIVNHTGVAICQANDAADKADEATAAIVAASPIPLLLPLQLIEASKEARICLEQKEAESLQRIDSADAVPPSLEEKEESMLAVLRAHVAWLSEAENVAKMSASAAKATAEVYEKWLQQQ